MIHRALLCVLALSPIVLAGETRFAEFESKDTWLQGQEFRNLILTSRGEIRLGFKSSLIRLNDEKAAWCGVATKDGLLVGTATGKIYSVAKDKVEEVFATGEMVVTSLVAVGEVVYAATIPHGKIFRFSQGKWEPFVTLDSKYVWQLVRSGNVVLAACGAPGKLVAVAADGSTTTVYEAGADNVLSVLPRDDGGHLVGTAGPGRLVRVENGRGVVVRDFETGEVRSIARTRNGFFIAVNSGAKVSPAEFLRATRHGDAIEPKPEGQSKGPVSCSIWKVNKDRVDAVADFPSTYVNELWATDEGVYAATNTSGRVYLVHEDGSYELHYDFKGNQALGFVPEAKAVLLGDHAQVGFMTGEPADEGEYMSAVVDTKFPSQFGHVAVRADGKIRLQTRSGNVSRPEDGWSDWSGEITNFPATITSPKARFFQFRLLIRDKTTGASRVVVAYKNENQRPRVSDLKIENQATVIPAINPGGSVNQVTKAGPLHASIKRISWQGSDPDGDSLEFSGFYREEESSTWVPLLGAKSTTNTFIQWNTESIPDGRYVIRIVASDAGSNLPGEALSAEVVSLPVLVDNTKPLVNVTIKDGTVVGLAQDRASNIVKLEYQIDGGDWKAIIPKGKILDSKRADFEFPLDVTGLARGTHTLTVRAYDQEYNAGLTSASFETK